MNNKGNIRTRSSTKRSEGGGERYKKKFEDKYK